MRWKSRERVGMLMVALSSLFLVGCPGGGLPALSATPSVLNFGASGVEESIAIYNSGGGTLNWSVAEDIEWLSPDAFDGSTTGETDRVYLTVDRSGLAVGNYQGTVTLHSNGGDKTISVAMKVPGTPQLTVTPPTVNLLDEQAEADLTLTNSGDDTVTWGLTVWQEDTADADSDGNDEELIQISIPDYLDIDPTNGSVAASSTSTVHVAIDRELMGDEPKNLTLRFTSNGGNQDVALNVSAMSAAVIAVDPAVLDFGDTNFQLVMDIYNDGASNSTLEFTLTTDRPDLIFFSPTSGTSVGTDLDIEHKDRVPVTVTLDRSAMRADTDGGKIFVSAPGLDPVEVLVSVDRAPLVFEGAMNRSRPPFIMRFVFLMRDSLGEAIDSSNPSVLEELQSAFQVYEDGEPLDTNETNLFVNDGSNLKTNVTLLLDYTGSMFAAGDGNGSAIAQMEAAAKEFVRDLPANYPLSVMEYHERQQASRLIHGFSTEREAILDAMDAFSVPPADHGASEVLDAVSEACERLKQEDEGQISFGETDVRALVFISDGRDTSSIASVDEVVQKAEEARVRLYPIGFGQNIDNEMLVKLAVETGGHYYAAATVEDLANLLEHETDRPAGAPGRIVTELSRQVVLTYITLHQEGNHTYLIRANYRDQEGSFQRDAVFAMGGDIRAGQITLTTSGIESSNIAEVFVRAEYVPRNISQLRFRLEASEPFTVELAPDGLLQDWTLVDEGNGVYSALTTEDNPLKYGSFGNLLKLTFNNVLTDAIGFDFRIDNRILVSPPFTKFFQYPSFLVAVREESSTETVFPLLLDAGFDPDVPGAWDQDGDSIPDFDDPTPGNTGLM